MKEVDWSMCAQDEENIEVILALLSNFFSSRKKEKNCLDIFRLYHLKKGKLYRNRYFLAKKKAFPNVECNIRQKGLLIRLVKHDQIW